MNQKFNKNAKVKKLTKKVGRGVRLIVIGPLLHFIFYPFPLHVQKHFYNHGNHLVFKYVLNDVGIGPLVREHKIYQQRLCTLSKIVVI